MTISSITPQDLGRLQSGDPNLRILDVRSPAEFQSVHAVAADNVPLDQLNPQTYVGQNSGDPLYVICKSGGRSMRACEQLAAAGHPHPVNVDGGTDAWAAAGLPVIEGQSMKMPIDCQVRVMSGSLVVIGAALSFLDARWAVLPLIIGGGLVYSGLTNTCGMASVLAKMPWNQAKSKKIDQAAASCDTGG